MKLLVFDKKGGYSSLIINEFNEKKFAHLVDSIHLNNEYYLKKNFSHVPHRLVYVSVYNLVARLTFEEIKDFESPKKTPDFILYFDESEELTDKDWEFLCKYFDRLFNYDILPFVNQRGYYLLETAKEPAEIAWHEYKLPEITEKVDSMVCDTDSVEEYYDFKEKFVNERDVALFEIRKPYTDLPYTMVVREFSKVGYLPLFSGFYIEMSWGVSPKDDAYLRFLWDQLKMEGDCDLEKLQKERALKCYPAKGVMPDPPPEVYRKSIDDVLKDFDMRETGKDYRFY